MQFAWGDDQENSFQKLKEKLILKPSFFERIHTDTDTSNEGNRVILSQGETGKN
jgi:hypothetical protein